MAATEIDLTAGLQVKRSRTGDRNKFMIEIDAPSLKLNLDEQAIAAPFARALAVEMKAALLAGLRMDGSSMPAPHAATVKRREYRDKQAARAFVKVAVTRRYRAHVRRALRAADPQAKMKTARSGATKWSRWDFSRDVEEDTRQQVIAGFRSGVGGGDSAAAMSRQADQQKAEARNFDRRFRALKIGMYNPTTHSNGHAVGVESGMLADSIVVEPNVARGGWAVYVTDRRSFIDRSGNSPAKRVFERSGFLRNLTANAVLRKALVATADAILMHRAAKVLRELGRTVKHAADVAQQVEYAVATGTVE